VAARVVLGGIPADILGERMPSAHSQAELCKLLLEVNETKHCKRLLFHLLTPDDEVRSCGVELSALPRVRQSSEEGPLAHKIIHPKWLIASRLMVDSVVTPQPSQRPWCRHTYELF
jgi:hypothetical protein